ncbi:fluoride efflux transporter CrcB [Alkalicoccus daliensis]|uniref:Fluoride-specific ion channel FluC n=1 Tax=Alkalicoccus daliensis TaxID=745820 RepID=A0A1H0IS53_9BACI|nr:fluoride efflux transporter CrcB [Alkalicoccus daliensis]SDO34299.1 camphor resistance protein CrcB [Alkalicoccus daliensis]
MSILFILFSGAAGAVSRYLAGLFLSKRFPADKKPLPMLLVNILGSFGLGIFLSLRAGTVPLDIYSDPWLITIGTGFFGAFTTFSTFSVEAVTLFQQKKWMFFLWYVSLSIIGSLAAFIFGFILFS